MLSNSTLGSYRLPFSEFKSNLVIGRTIPLYTKSDDAEWPGDRAKAGSLEVEWLFVSAGSVKSKDLRDALLQGRRQEDFSLFKLKDIPSLFPPSDVSLASVCTYVFLFYSYA
jgi:hypothetical protein